MKIPRFFSFAICVFWLLIVMSSASKADPAGFLKIDGIKGESQDSQHPNSIEVESFSKDANTFTITRRVDKTSAELHKALASGKAMPEAVFFDKRKSLTIKFTGVITSSVQALTPRGTTPMERWTFSFTKSDNQSKAAAGDNPAKRVQ